MTRYRSPEYTERAAYRARGRMNVQGCGGGQGELMPCIFLTFRQFVFRPFGNLAQGVDRDAVTSRLSVRTREARSVLHGVGFFLRGRTEKAMTTFRPRLGEVAL